MKSTKAVMAMLALAEVQSFGGGIDRRLLVDFLSVPSESHNNAEINRSIDVLKAWLEPRGVF